MVSDKKSSLKIGTILSSVERKIILTENELNDIILRGRGEYSLPLSIFESSLGMLESISLYLKDECNLSFKDISRYLKRDYKTIWASYNKAKRKKSKNNG